MNNLFELHQQASKLLEKHQQDIEEKLANDINQIFENMSDTLDTEARLFKNNIDTALVGIKLHQNTTIQKLKHQIDETTASLLTHHQQHINSLSQQNHQQLQTLQADLQRLNTLNQSILNTSKLKKTLFIQNLILISISCIALISCISLGYISWSKYNDIQAMQNKVQYLKSQGGSLNLMKCGSEKDWKWCVQIDPTAQPYTNNMRIVQETN